MDWMKDQYPTLAKSAVTHFWHTRTAQAEKQKLFGKADQGARGAVTGGAQMDGFAKMLLASATDAGIPEECVFFRRALELPGFFRPTKLWDMIVVCEDRLLAALELKSHVGPSFGNNFNNRTEEAMGSALDIWTAYRQGAFQVSAAPWLGYVMLLEDCPRSRAPVKVAEPHFPVFPEFRDASYARRYELFCRKLVLERHYSCAALLTSSCENGLAGAFAEPAEDLGLASFVKAFRLHLKGHVG